MAQCEGPRAQSVRIFYGLHLYLAGRCCKIPQVPGSPCSVNPAHVSRSVGVMNTWLIGITIVPLYNNNSPPPRQFLHEMNTFEKGNARGI